VLSGGAQLHFIRLTLHVSILETFGSYLIILRRNACKTTLYRHEVPQVSNSIPVCMYIPSKTVQYLIFKKSAKFLTIFEETDISLTSALFGSRCVVRLATMLYACGFRVRIQIAVREFSLLQNFQTGSGARTASYSMRTGIGGKAVEE